jgi:hypothetical protein
MWLLGPAMYAATARLVNRSVRRSSFARIPCSGEIGLHRRDPAVQSVHRGVQPVDLGLYALCLGVQNRDPVLEPALLGGKLLCLGLGFPLLGGVVLQLVDEALAERRQRQPDETDQQHEQGGAVGAERAPQDAVAQPKGGSHSSQSS